MASVRLLTIPHGAKVDAEGKGHGDDWPLLDLGESDTGRHYLTTDHCHASDLCDDAVIGDPEALGKFMVLALNGRMPVGLFNAAARLWGVESQMLMAVEECAELQQAILHFGRGRATKEDVADELADVSIMLEQVSQLLGVRDLCRERKRVKLERLSQRVYEAQMAERKANLPPTVPPPSFTPSDPTAKNCGTCRHWETVLVMDPMEDSVGACGNPTRPWEAWSDPQDHWAAAVRAEDEQSCHEFPEAKPC